MHFRKEGDWIIESWFSFEQAQKSQWEHRVAGHLVGDKILEKDRRFEIKYKKEDMRL